MLIYRMRYYSITLKPHRWAALASDIQNMRFACRFIKTNNQQGSGDCIQSLHICHYPRVGFSDSNQGSYWVSHGDTLKVALRKAIKNGILLRW